jgi:hypothetical protein
MMIWLKRKDFIQKWKLHLGLGLYFFDGATLFILRGEGVSKWKLE